MGKNIRVRAVISGRVQGVWFRMETKQAADRNGVFGWVRNRRDGSVEAVFEGPEEGVNATLSWCREGPPLARVDHIDLNWESCTGEFSGFEVTY